MVLPEALLRDVFMVLASASALTHEHILILRAFPWDRMCEDVSS